MKLSYLLLERKLFFNLLDDEDFTIPYVTDTITNPLDIHQLPTKDKRNVCIIYINVEDPITDQGVPD